MTGGRNGRGRRSTGVGNSLQTRQTSTEPAIARLADRQHGNVKREQLLRLGLNNDAIAHRRWLHRVDRGVYSVGRPPKTALEWAAAAVLACGPDAVLSHRSALALWGLAKWQRAIHVTVPTDRRPKGLKVHRVKSLTGRDRRTHQGIRVTSPARALLDCAPGLTDKALTRAFNDGRRARLLSSNAIADVVERFPYHPGAGRLTRFVDVKGGPTRSEWEDAFPAFCRQYGLPEPLMSTGVAGYEVDALFVEEKVIVELDGWDFHSDREAFESDRDRDADTLAAGCHTVRITWERLHERPAEEAVRLHEILRLWAPERRPSPSEPPGSTVSPGIPDARRPARDRPSR
jgi:hypothetical protein